MNFIKKIQTRNSARLLEKPYPTKSELKEVYTAALRAPDHAWLKPTSFIEIKDAGIDKLSKVFKNYAIKNDKPTEIIEKYSNAPYRAPMIIAVVNNYKKHPKVPKIEQMLSSAASCQNILLSLEDIGYGCIWRTGKLAFNKDIGKSLGLNENQEIIAFIYVGTKVGKSKKIPTRNIDDFINYL